jgi:hypothetical protein
MMEFLYTGSIEFFDCELALELLGLVRTGIVHKLYNAFILYMYIHIWLHQ